MKLGTVFLTSDTTGEVVFGEWFMNEAPITQKDLLQDIIADLQKAYDKIDLSSEKSFSDILDDFDGTPHFNLQRMMYRGD